MKTLEQILRILSEHRRELEERFKIKEIAVFGSYTRGEQEEQSDLDLLIEFEEGFKTFDNYMDSKFYLEDLLNTNIDLVLKSALKERLKEAIIKEAVNV